MLRIRTLAPTVMALTLATAACEDNTTGPVGEISADDLAEVALDLDDQLGGVLTEEGQQSASSGSVMAPSFDVVVTDRTFSVTRTCPEGGSAMWDGSAHREFDTETGVMTGSFTGTRTRTDCAFARGEFTITVNGSGTWTKERRRLDGQLDGLQTSTHVGSFTALRSDGAERSCGFDVTIVRDPDARTVTIDGTMCAAIIHRVRNWNAIG
ncbi:MAG: hypothetical protein ACR2QM_17630 [Longimicrobiales bacterium]